MYVCVIINNMCKFQKSIRVLMNTIAFAKRDPVKFVLLDVSLSVLQRLLSQALVDDANFMLQRDANMSKADLYRQMPFDLAAVLGDTEFATRLVGKGAVKTARDKRGLELLIKLKKITICYPLLHYNELFSAKLFIHYEGIRNLQGKC